MLSGEELELTSSEESKPVKTIASTRRKTAPVETKTASTLTSGSRLKKMRTARESPNRRRKSPMTDSMKTKSWPSKSEKQPRRK